MNPYSGRYAELYDIFYKDKPYASEAAFVHTCLKEYGRRPTIDVLELACGTGSHAIELEKLGYTVTATDYSDSMLAVARKKAASLSSDVEFYKQDMRSLNLQRGPFDAVVCLFDSIGYAVTNEALRQTLQGIHRSLHTDGLFVFEFWNAGAMLRNFDPVRVRQWFTEKSEVLRISETMLDHTWQICKVSYRVLELNNDGTYVQFKEIHAVRYFLLQEMAALLENNGFSPLKWFTGFSAGEDISDNTWHIISVARKC
jgi:ubiquinone/menaquinone biosynthesis C-methylase UbiE